MASFDANITPISAPTLSGSSADNLASYQGSFISSIVTTGNDLLQSYLDLKETDFFSVGDLPDIWQQWFASDPANWQRFNERPDTNRPAITYSDLQNAIDTLAALAPPDAPTLGTVDSDTPELEATAPTITLPSQPDTTLPTAPTGEPEVVDPVLPTAPTYTLPDLPTFDELNLPPSPALSIPAYNEVAPSFNVQPYTNEFSYVDPGYTSELRDELVVKLLNDLQNGTYGIEPGDEAGLWSRARDRAASIAKSEITGIMRRASASGFPMPSGAMYEAMREADQKHTNALSEAEREITLRRSELYVEGRKFTFQQVQQYERMAQDLYNATQERALNYAKALVDYGLAVYNSSLQHFNAQLQAYQVKAQVFESKIRAELAKAEIFKTQIQGEMVRVEFNKAKIQQYQAQVDGIKMAVEVYRSELAATGLQMQVQQQKIDIFRAQLQNYSERLRAKEAEYNIYLASTRGELAKVDVYKAQIDAYNATLSGRETKARVQLQSNEALMQEYRAAIGAYQANLDSALKVLQARIDDKKLRNLLYNSDIDAYRALTASTSAAQNSLLEWGRLQQNYINARTAQESDNVRFRLEQLSKTIQLQENVNRYGIDFLRAALGGAISGLNSLGVKTGEE